MGYIGYVIRLLKDLKNPPFFLYHIFHYANLNLPVSLAKCIASRNVKDYLSEGTHDIVIKTIDGSNQVVHPDIVMDYDMMALVCTPYPYGMEEYENPCLYYGESLDKLRPILCPLDVQSSHKQGYHMSDPSIASIESDVYCIYRDTAITDDFIYLKKISFADTSCPVVSDRILLLHAKDNYVLSPAVLLEKDQILIYHVKTDRHKSQLLLNTFDRHTFEHGACFEAKIEHEPKGCYLWHIGISADNNSSKQIDERSILKGLFLYINQENNKSFKLYVAQNIIKDLKHWEIQSEVVIPEAIKNVIKFPYKSCFDPKSGGILLSFRDNKDRNRLALLIS